MSGVYKPRPSGFVTLHPGNCLLLQECAVTLRTVNMIIIIDDKVRPIQFARFETFRAFRLVFPLPRLSSNVNS